MTCTRFVSHACSHTVAFRGPPLSSGPLPTVFYFALSAEDSLCLDPFNQPVAHFAHDTFRVFSVTIPGHEPPLRKEAALTLWAEALHEKRDILTPFFEEVAALIRELIAKNIASEDAIGCLGLSRGGFVALHVAARLPFLTNISLFAPLLTLEAAAECASLDNEILKTLSLDQHLDALASKRLRISIGNADTRVRSADCLSFFQALCTQATKLGIRQPKHELHVIPSIGYKGHGTSPETFSQGATWLSNFLHHK